ncbi:MAG: CopD family protein [Alphaproteobacteria bacterium]|nr:CopD family protein [Alphaproteobacteria bacterium]MCY3754676.1 CopD family protein [Alphaproteobacteria bacterium]
MSWLFALYPWIKALHIAAVVFWMAGMLYLPRLFIYHLETEPGAADSERFKVMERRLLRVIVNPAMIAAFLFGGLLLWVSPNMEWDSGWLWGKLAGVAVLSWLHHVFARWRKHLDEDGRGLSARRCRLANEAPALLTLAIVILVVVKPF